MGLLTPLLHLQRLFIPALLALVAWAIWRLIFRRDMAVGLVLYLGLVIVVDGFYNTGIYLPGFPAGSIRYSELCAVFLLLNRPAAARDHLGHDVLYVPAGNAVRVVAAAIVSLIPYRVTQLVGLYFALMLVSAFSTEPVMAGIFEWRRIVIPQIVAFLVAKRGLGSREEYGRFLLALMALVLVVALFTFWDVFFDRWLLKSDSLLTPEYSVTRQQGRFGSLFINPNYLGAFVVLVFPAAFFSALRERRPLVQLYAWAGLLGLAFSLVETQSRGPLIAFCISLIALIVGPFQAISRRLRVGYLAAFLAIFVAFMPGFIDHAVERFASIDQETTTSERSRQSVWNYTLKIIADHPLAGIGFGEKQFLKVMDDYGFTNQYNEQSLDNPHNSYLQMAVYAGIPALVVFLLANLVLLAKAARLCMRYRAETETFSFAVGIAGFLACIYPDMHMFTMTVAPVYWVFFGLLLSLAQRKAGIVEHSPLRRRRVPLHRLSASR